MYKDLNQKQINRLFTSNRGVSRLVVILLAAIAIMSVLIAFPVYKNMEEQGKRKIDEGREQTAWDSAYMKFVAEGGPFTVIYDCEQKQFIERLDSMREFDKITAYGEAKEHIGKVILVNVSKDGEIDITWIGREEYRKVNHG